MRRRNKRSWRRASGAPILLLAAAAGACGGQDAPTAESGSAGAPPPATSPAVTSPAATSPAAAPSARAVTDTAEVWVELTRGGAFDRPIFEPAQARLSTGVAWWLAAGPAPVTLRLEEPSERSPDGWVLRLPPGASVRQVLACPGDSFARATLDLRSTTPVAITLTDADGARLDLSAPGGVWHHELSSWAGDLGRAPRPPIELTLAATDRGAEIDRVSVRAPLPLPDRAALRREIIENLDWTIQLVLRTQVDSVGERRSTLEVFDVDVLTGERVSGGLGWVTAFSELLLEAWRYEPREDWEQLLTRHIEDLLELCLDPGTGLPVFYDPMADRRRGDTALEIARAFRFLLDCAEHGPEALRERTRAAAVRIGDGILERGRLASGELLVKYVPSTGEGTTRVPRLRALDLVGPMARLTPLTGDDRYARAANVALDEFEYLHRWAGDWFEIDPGFDDQLGNWGATLATKIESGHASASAERLFRTGVEYYDRRWELSVLHGAQNAADQVRTWRVLARAAALDPSLAPRVDVLLEEAVDAHLVGQFSAQGIWVDNTHFLWRPRGALETGDLPGVPGNLLEGLGICAAAGLGHELDELCGWFTAVMRTSYAHFGREYGCLPAPIEARGANPSGAEIRMGYALTEMLGALSE